MASSKNTDKSRAAEIESILIELHPLAFKVVESLDSDAFWWFYNEYLTLDVEEQPDDTEQRKVIKSLRRALLLRFKARYEEEFVERKIEQ